MTMFDRFDTLSDKQREVAELMVESEIERRNTGAKKLSQEKLGESVGVTGRTIRNWQKDETFLAYLEYLSRLKIQAAMPSFAAVLISNLEKGQNLSTKQLDLIAKIADWLPEPKSSSHTVNVQVGTDSLEERILKLEEKKRKTVFDASTKIETQEAVYVETD